MEELTEETITIGKFKNKKLKTMLRDRNYCKWLLEQDWFKKKYEYLYNRVKNYNPSTIFISEKKEGNFLQRYKYFNLVEVDELKVELCESDKICYKNYLEIIGELRSKIEKRERDNEENIYSIKAPTKWLKKFEEFSGLSRSVFKEFLAAHELPNIPYIVEDIKAQGGIEYKGARSFLIAKKRSVEQENWWEPILKEKFGEDLSTQYKYENCIFDFLCIKRSTIYECKLGLKDFDCKQYAKYLKALESYKIVYLIGKHTIIHFPDRKVYTTNLGDYLKDLSSKKIHEKFLRVLEMLDCEEIVSSQMNSFL